MQTQDMLDALTKAGYPLSLISNQSKISYMKLYRYAKGTNKLSEDEESRIRRFAIVQPIFVDAKGEQ